MSKGNKLLAFIKRHPILSNFVLIIITGFFLVWFMLNVVLGIWTRHGETIRVPGVEGMQIVQACQVLHDGGFTVEVDSIYEAGMVAPGAVVSQSPIPNTVVKEGRTVYLTFRCYSKKLVKVPYYFDMSCRQAIALFDEVGLTNVSVKMVPSEHADLVLGAYYNGLRLQPGSEIPVDTQIMLQVGDGHPEIVDPIDSEEADPVYQEDVDAEYIRQLEEVLRQI